MGKQSQVQASVEGYTCKEFCGGPTFQLSPMTTLAGEEQKVPSRRGVIQVLVFREKSAASNDISCYSDDGQQKSTTMSFMKTATFL
ncbi:hypothetical protein DUI87_11101 [Hirundo rustica rustica]|uniref:Uncharacterized protein n=1 Tax=Hirundo rustica rustica TaxID=333673 RepID=A0A3M0KFI1_HIRRU|nr:hypothetical protein DUI87_11101 [Hirundo rustica rustica]